MSLPIASLALRNLGRRPRRTFLSVLSIGLAAFTLTLLFSVIAGLFDDLEASARRFFSGDVLIEDLRAARATDRPLALSVFGASALASSVASVPGVASVHPRVVTGASVFVDGNTEYFPVMGLDFASDPFGLDEFLRAGGRLPNPGTREALVSTGLAEALGLAVGDRVTAVTQTLRGSSNGMTFTVVGVVHPDLGSFQSPWLFAPLATVQSFVRLGDAATTFLVVAQAGAGAEALAPRVAQALADAGAPTSVVASPWWEGSVYYGFLRNFFGVYLFMGFCFLALASTVIMNTILMVVLERCREIGMLAALGMTRRQVRHLFLAESAWMGFLGALFGVGVGAVVVAVLHETGIDYSEAMKGMDLGARSVIRPVLNPLIPPAVALAAVAVTLGFTFWPLGRIHRLPIIDALRGDTTGGPR